MKAFEIGIWKTRNTDFLKGYTFLSNQNQTVLLVDDEEHILELLKFNLINAGFNVATAANGEKALRFCQEELPDLVLLDVMLPGLDGFEICKKLKAQPRTAAIPIIMITAKSDELDKLIGFELGADDYITKPFNIRELVARVKALLRRSYSVTKETIEQETIKAGDLVMDTTTYEVTQGDKLLELTLKEFEMLKLLIKGGGKVLTREFLLDSIWGYEYFGETRTVDVHIRHLRQKLSDENGNKYIETVRGIGYKFNYKDEK